MPMKPPRACRYPGCPGLCDPGKVYCQRHMVYSEDRERDLRRGNSAERGYNTAWKRARSAYLAKHPLCVECLKRGKTVPATVVDHIIPHRGDKVLFWDRNNWQSLCKPCHDNKTGHGE